MSAQVLPAVPVLASEPFGAYRVLWVHAPGIARAIEPGQFVSVATPVALLRRPFSVYRTDGDAVSIAFDAIGEATSWLAERAPGDELNVLGPLGTGFTGVPDDRGALLVGGGYGTAALSMLAERFAAHGGNVHAIVGARTAARLFDDPVLRDRCASVRLVTEDGSAGVRGVVTDVVPEVLRSHRLETIYACGPMRMLEAVARVAESQDVSSRLAVEEFMACGIGVCWTCVVPVRTHGVVKHLRSCTEGPVFDGRAIEWV